MSELPSGTLTVLHTEIEGSTLLTVHLGDRYPEVLATHCALLRAAFAAHEGHEVDTQGDSFFVVFPRATQAVAAAVAMQRALAAEAWPEGGTVRVRIGMHTGEPIRTAAGYTGLDVIRGARIKDAGHGGQVLLSKSTAALIEDALIDGLSLRDLGAYRLKDLPRPERIFQLIIPDLPADFPPLQSLDTPGARAQPRAGAGADDGALRRHGRLDGTARRARRPLLARTASAVQRARPPGAGPPRRGGDGYGRGRAPRRLRRCGCRHPLRVRDPRCRAGTRDGGEGRHPRR